MMTDASTDVHFSAGMQTREQNAALPPPEDAKWKRQTPRVELCTRLF